MTFCSSLNFVISCSEEKFNSLETALHFKIFFGTLADNQTKKKNYKVPPLVISKQKVIIYLIAPPMLQKAVGIL